MRVLLVFTLALLVASPAFAGRHQHDPNHGSNPVAQQARLDQLRATPTGPYFDERKKDRLIHTILNVCGDCH